MDLKDRLKGLRGDLTREEFAKRVGISPTAVYYLETGLRGFGRDVLAKLIQYDPSLYPAVMQYLADYKETI